MLADLKPTEILIILLVVLLLFGAKRLPDLAKAVGKSVKILKNEVKDLHDDGQPTETAGNAAPTASPTSPSRPTDATEHHQV